MLKGGKHILKLFMQISFCCSGLDLFAYEPQSHAFHLVESKKFNVSWYLYTHESRLILLASGMQCTMFTGYQVMAPAWDKIIETQVKTSFFLFRDKTRLMLPDAVVVLPIRQIPSWEIFNFYVKRWICFFSLPFFFRSKFILIICRV